MGLSATRAGFCAAFLAGAVAALVAAPARAQTPGPLVVVATVAVKGGLEKIVPAFEKTSGRSVSVEYGAASALTARISGGGTYDVLITNAATIDGLAGSGSIAGDTVAPFGRAVASLAFKHGHPVPDTSSPEALKATLLAAKSFSFSDPALGGASSVYFSGVIAGLGITDAVMKKATLTKVGEGALPLVNGQVEYAVAQSSEYAPLPGLDGVPLAPDDPKSKGTFSAGVSAKSAQPDTARAFVRFLLSPEGTAIRKAMGLL